MVVDEILRLCFTLYALVRSLDHLFTRFRQTPTLEHTGTVTAKIYHGRPWLKKEFPKLTIEFRVKECKDHHNVMKTMSSMFDRFTALHKEAMRYDVVTRDSDWYVGEEIFRLREAMYHLESAVEAKKKAAKQESNTNHAITTAHDENANLKSKLEDLCERASILTRRIQWLEGEGKIDWSNILVAREHISVPEMAVQIHGKISQKEIELRSLLLTNKEIEKVVSTRQKKVNELEKELTNLLLSVKLTVPLPWSSASSSS